MAFWDTIFDLGAYKLQAINKSDKWGYYVLAIEKDYFKDMGLLSKLLLKIANGIANQGINEEEYVKTSQLIYDYLLKKNLQKAAEELRAKFISLYQFTEKMDVTNLNQFLKYLTPLLIENIHAFGIEDLKAVYNRAGLFLASGESRVLVKQRLTRYITNSLDAFSTQNGKFPTFDIYILDDDFKRLFTKPTHPSDAWLIYDFAVYVADRNDIEKDDVKRVAMGGSFTHLY